MENNDSGILIVVYVVDLNLLMGRYFFFIVLGNFKRGAELVELFDQPPLKFLIAFKHLRGVEWVHGLFMFPLVFWENAFLCSLDNLLQKNVIVFFFENQISKWRSFEKRATFDPLFIFFSHQGKATQIPSAHISITYIHVFCSPY